MCIATLIYGQDKAQTMITDINVDTCILVYPFPVNGLTDSWLLNVTELRFWV